MIPIQFDYIRVPNMNCNGCNLQMIPIKIKKIKFELRIVTAILSNDTDTN